MSSFEAFTSKTQEDEEDEFAAWKGRLPEAREAAGNASTSGVLPPTKPSLYLFFSIFHFLRNCFAIFTFLN